MKRKNFILTAAAIGSSMILSAVVAQTLNISVGNLTYKVDSGQAGVMTFNDGETLTVQERVIPLSEISGMTVTDDDYDDNTVEIIYDGDNAYANIAGNIAQHIDVDIKGANVSITQGSGVGDETGEITYVLSGESENGSFTLDGSYKATIELQGLTLTNPAGAAIDIENGKRIELSSKNGTVNTLVDGASGSQKAALYCKGHLELKGKGTLNVTGNKSHAIAAKEYVEMKNCTLNILGSVKDGINCTQYFLLESGNLNLSGIGEDGIQTDFKDSEGKRDKEDTGSIEIQGGTLNVTVSGVAAKALKAEGDFIISSGEVTAVSNSDGEWDSSKSKTKASSCIGADGDVTVNGGSMTLTATGGGGKGISCDGTFTMNDGDINITTSGGVLAYVNGSLSQNYTGNTDRLDSDAKSSPKGIKADTEVLITGGTIYVKTTGNNGEGIESKGILTVEGGDITVRAKDDAINSSSHMYIKGGTINVIATNNDGLDSNGDIYISGGLILAFGANSPECGLDANDEEGYSVYFTGGHVLAVGGRNSVPKNSNSTQAYVIVNQSVKGGNEISISSGSEVLYTFTVPEDYTTSSSGSGWGPGGGMGGSSLQVLISVPGLVNGQSYTVKNGTATNSANARLTGGSSGPGGRPIPRELLKPLHY